MIFVEEIGDFFGKETDLSMAAKTHSVSVDCLLPPQCSPPHCKSAPTTKNMNNFSPATSLSPDVGPDSAGNTRSRRTPLQNIRLLPKSVYIESVGHPLIWFTTFIRPAIILILLVIVLNSSCRGYRKNPQSRLLQIIAVYFQLLQVTIAGHFKLP